MLNKKHLNFNVNYFKVYKCCFFNSVKQPNPNSFSFLFDFTFLPWWRKVTKEIKTRRQLKAFLVALGAPARRRKLSVRTAASLATRSAIHKTKARFVKTLISNQKRKRQLNLRRVKNGNCLIVGSRLVVNRFNNGNLFCVMEIKNRLVFGEVQCFKFFFPIAAGKTFFFVLFFQLFIQLAFPFTAWFGFAPVNTKVLCNVFAVGEVIDHNSQFGTCLQQNSWKEKYGYNAFQNRGQRYTLDGLNKNFLRFDP